MSSSTAAVSQQQQQQNDREPTITSFTTTKPTTTDRITASSNKPTTSPTTTPTPVWWHNAAAGAVAGASARLATAPLDLVRIRAQLERDVTYPRPNLFKKLHFIYQQEGGFLALFRGSVAATYLWIGYSMVQFSVYGSVKLKLQQQEYHHSLSSPTAVAFISGATAGLCATVSTYPFDICRTVFAAQGLTTSTTAQSQFAPPKSLMECATRMYTRNGLGSFFVGVYPAMVQIVPYMGLNFGIYDWLISENKSIGASGYAGSISGATSKMLVYPMDTIKKRLQYQSVFGATESRPYYTGMVDCAVTMIKTEGISAFYRGLVPSVLKTTIGSGLSFTFFRLTKNVLEEFSSYSGGATNNGGASGDKD